MKTTLLILGTTGLVTEVVLDLPEDPGYDKLKEVVQPYLTGLMEHVTVLHEGDYVDMFVDEEGMLKGLPRNDKATAIYRNNALTHDPSIDAESLPFICGDVVLFTRRVWF